LARVDYAKFQEPPVQLAIDAFVSSGHHIKPANYSLLTTHQPKSDPTNQSTSPIPSSPSALRLSIPCRVP
jgi:hypothetical protein